MADNKEIKKDNQLQEDQLQEDQLNDASGGNYNPIMPPEKEKVDLSEAKKDAQN